MIITQQAARDGRADKAGGARDGGLHDGDTSRVRPHFASINPERIRLGFQDRGDRYGFIMDERDASCRTRKGIES
jgi:hypothetical protein